MTFKVVSVGWSCAALWQRTLASIEAQTVADYEVWVTYDGGDDAGPAIQAWCDEHGPRWHCTLTDTQQYAGRNQVESLRKLDPQDDDIIVFLDLDGDRLAHPLVFDHLRDYYADDTLVTYGSYRPDPPNDQCPPASAFPDDIIAANGYRAFVGAAIYGCRFNHLRTMKGRVFRSIPDSYFHRGDDPARWYEYGTDYVFMVSALELAGPGRHKFIPEVLMIYTSDNPHADHRRPERPADDGLGEFLRRAPLLPLPSGPPVELEIPPSAQPAPEPECDIEPETFSPDVTPEPEVRDVPYLPAAERIEIIRDHLRQYAVRIFIETGTANGDTAAALAPDCEQVYTIEVGQEAYEKAAARFEGSNVRALWGDSADQLALLLDGISEPALLWLDAHYCGSDRGEKDTPVLEELAAIFASGQRHIILIDDARLFEGMICYGEHDWPHIDEVAKLAEAAGWVFGVSDDIIRLIPLDRWLTR